MIRTTYKGSATSKISFPLGGIGSGSIGLGGNGRLLDWEIYNRPAKGSLNGFSHFAVKAEKPDGTLVDARVLNGDYDQDMSGQYGLNFGHGMPGGTMAGFPHFAEHVFEGKFPTAEITFDDPHFPGRAKLFAFNPMIPLNDKDSSIPAAFFEILIENGSGETLDFSAAFSVRNPNSPSVNSYFENYRLRGIKLGQKDVADDDPDKCDLTVATSDLSGSAQEYWYRGGWSDAVETFWRNFTEGTDFTNRRYDWDAGGDHATLAVKKRLAPGECGSFRFVLAWNKPNNFNYWNPMKDENGRDVTWKNYYATVFEDSADSATYALANWDELLAKTVRFRDEFFSSTLPDEVIEAASATMSVLKTATVFRLENGEFYGWEGLNEHSGSCEGTCAHVWNYAYALCFLFPSLERSIRDLDYRYNRDENGRMQFRMQLPLGRARGTWRACVDGQMGGVIKSWREWKISGDTDWLRANWEGIKASLEYAWNPNNFDGWDRDMDGVLEGRQHHTLDMELFGPSSWLEGFYLCALKCGAEMARAMGEEESARLYEDLFAKGRKWTDENLFNGKWYFQKVDLSDKAKLEPYTECGSAMSYWNDEAGQMKYQIGEGSEIDQLLAQWHADILGLGDIFDPEQRKTALRSLYEHNYAGPARERYNPFRLYSVNGERGAVICVYPDGAKKPAIPIPYCQETMHGFEYALAGLMMAEGMNDEGLEIVRSVRDRYDGAKRNPWNEIECGSNYARSMASFSFLPILSGFVFDMTKKRIGWLPRIDANPFRCFWSLEGAWGRVEIADGGMTVTVLGGSLNVREVVTALCVSSVTADGAEVGFGQDGDTVRLAEDTAVSGTLVLRA
ncbi:MAG: hypothetical protein E7576_14200 [Ruminococcaceae bacterium]|jgi:uncharacterized protein (DUF608 family)|nr:hypothetical protein [Oscillospiraceae bacterium]